jgi:sterol O-acyltransferase
MSTSAEVQVTGNGFSDHDYILRPRALKPGNPAVLRTQSEQGRLTVGEIATASGQTRYGNSTSFT